MLYLGTSGWSYKDWGKTFYPQGLPAREQLSYLAKHFPTVELNASFYRLPAEKTFTNWREITPNDFRFAVKVSQLITHQKHLNDVSEAWQTFFDRASLLGPKLGVCLLQFPPSFAATDENLDRLKTFIDAVDRRKVRLAFELRHKTWFEQPQLDLLTKYKLCLVQAESSRYPHSPENFSPATFAYYRFHGPRELYGSSYNDAELDYWAKLIQTELNAGKDVYVYFDNDMHGYALEDARRLRDRLQA